MQIPRRTLTAVTPLFGPSPLTRFLEASAKTASTDRIASLRSSYDALLHLQVWVGLDVRPRRSFRLHLGASQASGEFADQNPFISSANHMSCSILVG